MGPTASLDGAENFAPLRDSIPGPSSPLRVTVLFISLSYVLNHFLYISFIREAFTSVAKSACIFFMSVCPSASISTDTTGRVFGNFYTKHFY
jgi:hypothetical protein